MLFFVFLTLFTVFAEVPDTEEIEPVDVSLLYTGNRFGVSTERYNFPSIRILQTTVTDGEVRIRSAHHVMVQKNWLLFSDDKTVTGTLDFLAGQQIACSQQVSVSGWQREYETVLARENTERYFKGFGDSVTYNRWICQNEFGKKAELVSTDEQIDMSWRWEDFEFRPSVHVFQNGKEVATLIGRSRQELSRTIARIAKEKSWYPDRLYVDAGSFVGGSTSVKPNGLSLHRPLEYAILQDLEPTALGIGVNELILGMNNFRKEIEGRNLPYVGTNITVNEERIFPTSIQKTVRKNGREVSIAFLGILEPKWLDQLPVLASEKVDIEDPNEAIARELKRLMDSNAPPDVVVLLTTASSATKSDIRRWSSGVDLMLGDSTMATFRLQNRKMEFFPYDKEKQGAPVTLPMDGLSALTLTIENVLRSVEHKTIFVREDFAIDPKISTTMTQNRMQYYPLQEELLLQPKGEGWQQQLSQKDWEDLVCQLVLEKTDADTVLLRELPRIHLIPGVLTKKQVADALAIMDVVEVHRISGAQYPTFLSQVYKTVPLACGAKPGPRAPKVKGRPIDSAQVYLVATTDQTRLSSELKKLLPAHQSRKVWDRSGAEVQTMDSGEYLSLRELVLSTLEAEKELASVETITSRIDRPVEREILFRLRKASLLTEGLQSPEDERYEAVPESMLNNQSSSTRGWSGDVALEYYAKNIRSDLRFRSTFSELTLEEETQEVSDDWILSSSHTLPGIQLKMGSLRWSPYSELMFDSEFSAQELDDGTQQSKQSDLSLTAGISSLSWRLFRNIKMGVFANRDLAQISEKPTEFGGKMEWVTSKPFASYLIWTTSGTMQVYADTPDDDASDLRWRLGANNKFTLPLSQYFGISIYNDVLGVQGRTEINDQAIFAWTMGVSFDVLGAFALLEE